MSKLPVISGEQIIQAFTNAGWQVKRRESTHVTLKRRGAVLILTVPTYREVDAWILRKLIRDAGLTVAQFRELLDD
jgi:predicted RNA binding protein YcfA (HicA-like mRNA interferase family)